MVVHVVAFEGPIGAGKSTLLGLLKCLPNVIVVPEPLELWRGLEDGKFNLLEDYYREPGKHAAAFQLWAAHTRMKAVKDVIDAVPAHETKIVLVERMGAGVRSFTQFLHEQGHVTSGWKSAVHHMLKDWEAQIPCHLIVRVQVSMDEAQRRIAKRGRGEEDAVTVTMQTRLEEILDAELTQQPTPVLVIDANGPWTDGSAILESIKAKVAAT